MSSLPASQPASAPAPPTQPYVMPPPPKRPVWPTVVGVMAIAWGVLGVLAGAGGVIGFLMFSRFQIMPGSPPELTQVMADFAPRMMMLAAGMGLLAALGLLGGVGIVRRMHWSVTITRGWAVLKLSAALVEGFMTYSMQTKQLAVMQSGAGAPPMAGAIFTAMPVVAAAVGFAFAAALPVFMLVWFGRSRIRNEVQTWA